MLAPFEFGNVRLNIDQAGLPAQRIAQDRERMDRKLDWAVPPSRITTTIDGPINARPVAIGMPAIAGARLFRTQRITDTGWELARGIAFPMALLTLGVVTAELGWTDPAVVIAWLLLAPAVFHLGLQFRRDVAAELARSFERRSAIVCASVLGKNFRSTLASLPGVRFTGFFDDRAAARLGLDREEPLLGRISEVAKMAKERGIDVVYIALPASSQSRVADLLAQLEDTTASVYFVPDVPVFAPVKPRAEMLAGTPVVRMCETPFLGVDGVVKRVEDLVLGTILFFACLPLMLIIGLVVKIDSQGPVIFRQRRHGLDGREVVIYKFRTMKVLEDGPDVRQAQRDDPRLTRVGGFLRRTSLDELPQLLNVLQGRMSLVGPRPHPVAFANRYGNVISGYMIRHKVRPGITGWAQVNGWRGETDTLEKMRARVEHDLAYLSEWSLAFDLSILARTAWAVIRGDNAH